MKKITYILFVFLLATTLYLQQSCQTERHVKMSGADVAVPDIVDYNFHVKPILSDRCFTCHGPDENTREAGLRFDTKEGAYIALGEDKDHFAVVPGDTAASTLIDRIITGDPDDIMPPPNSNLTLTDREKKILTRWVEQGAEWKQHWSFIPPAKSAIPKVENTDWTNNEIDFYVLKKIEDSNLSPAAAAPKEQMLRRITFDLTGLPPTMEELENFKNDPSENALDKVIDRLFASDGYAEKMTTHWMDVARYADTHGYQDDLERIMFPWRDWVIHAYKNNMPYDQFVKWQLAGDMYPEATREQVIATAFNRNHKITQEGGVIPEEYRVEYVSDRTQTFGTAFLGLTMECSKCHDHKYDPISQKDYYSLFAFFNNVPEQGLIEPYGAIPEPYIKLTNEEIKATLGFINNADTIMEIPLMVMEEMKEPRQAYILGRGAYDNRTEPVDANTPSSLNKFGEELPPNRLGLAEWLFEKEHPLTARVAVNRLWQQCFGRGLVSTPEDFGNQGSLPTHPELLDFLALKFIADGWDVQEMLRFIVSSATYQQHIKVDPNLLERDPENLLLARAPRLRLPAEMIRDHALAISGLLNEEVGGPSVKPYQPKGLWQETTGGGGGSTSQYIEDEGDDLYRRSMYTFWKRTVPPPSMMTFDASTRDFCSVQRQNTSTPLQALVMMNDPQILEASRVLAYKAIASYDETKARIAMMFQLATSRAPNVEELEQLIQYFDAEKIRFNENEGDAEAILAVGQYEQKNALAVPEVAAYTVVANAIFNLDETISRG